MTDEARRVVDDDRFSTLFYASAARLVRLAALLGAADPEDVVQEAFCRVFAARGRIRGTDHEVSAYLRRAVVNEVRDRHRRRQVAQRSAHLIAVESTVREVLAADERDAVLRASRTLRHGNAKPGAPVLARPAAGRGRRVHGHRLGTAKAHVSRGLAAVTASLSEVDDDQDGVPHEHRGTGEGGAAWRRRVPPGRRARPARSAPSRPSPPVRTVNPYPCEPDVVAG